MLRFPGDDLLGAFDHTEVALRRTLGLGIEDALEGVLEVRGGHLPAILEFNAVPKLEGVGLTVGGDGVRFGDIRDELKGAGLVVHQATEESLHHRRILPIVADRRIQGRDVILVGNRHGAAMLRFVSSDRQTHGSEDGKSRNGKNRMECTGAHCFAPSVILVPSSAVGPVSSRGYWLAVTHRGSCPTGATPGESMSHFRAADKALAEPRAESGWVALRRHGEVRHMRSGEFG